MKRPGTLARLLGLCAALMLTGTSLAQQPGKKRKTPPVEIVNIDLGWGGSSLAADRWQPATVWITSQDKPFTGELTLTCQQDATQKAVMHVGPVATTPGQVTPVEIEFSPSTSTGEITISISNGAFRTGVRYLRNGAGDDLPLPRIGMGEAGHVVFLGETSGSRAVSEKASNLNPTPSQTASPDSTYDEARAFEQMMPSNVPLVRMPTAWSAYESVDVVVCDEEDLAKADPRARAALATWVRSGGRLVMRVDPVGPAWPDLLSDDPPMALAGGQQSLAFGADLRSLFPRIATSTLKGRALTITPAGLSRGWKPLFPVTPAENTITGSLGAHGPCGLGMVTLLGFEPSTVSPLVDDESTKNVWRTAMAPTLPPHAKRGGYQQYSWGYAESGDRETIGAINSSLDSIASVPPIGTGVFWAICLCVLCLALLLGPIDAKLLKRRRLSQYSWLTALCWITLAGMGAVLMPRIMRSARSTATRLVLVDSLCDSNGQPLETAHYALSGVFAGKPLSFSLADQKPGSWLKGVAAESGYYRNDDLITLPELHLGVQSEASELPIRAAWAGDIDVPQWSFRTVSDSAPILPAARSDIGARVQVVNGQRQVRLTNLPKGITVSGLWLGMDTGWYTVEKHGVVTDNQRDQLFTVTGQRVDDLGPWAQTPLDPSKPLWSAPEGTPASLPWVRERSDAVSARLATGRWACVCVKLEGVPANLSIHGVKGLEFKQTTMLRLLTPLEAE